MWGGVLEPVPLYFEEGACESGDARTTSGDSWRVRWQAASGGGRTGVKDAALRAPLKVPGLALGHFRLTERLRLGTVLEPDLEGFVRVVIIAGFVRNDADLAFVVTASHFDKVIHTGPTLELHCALSALPRLLDVCLGFRAGHPSRIVRSLPDGPRVPRLSLAPTATLALATAEPATAASGIFNRSS